MILTSQEKKKHGKKTKEDVYLLGIVHAVNGVNVKGFTLNRSKETEFLGHLSVHFPLTDINDTCALFQIGTMPIYGSGESFAAPLNNLSQECND